MIGKRYVQPSKKDGGWEIVKEGHRRATATPLRRSRQSLRRARWLAERAGARFASGTGPERSPTRLSYEVQHALAPAISRPLRLNSCASLVS